MLASAVFFYGRGSGNEFRASLFDAYDLIRDNVGTGKSGEVVRNGLIRNELINGNFR